MLMFMFWGFGGFRDKNEKVDKIKDIEQKYSLW